MRFLDELHAERRLHVPNPEKAVNKTSDQTDKYKTEQVKVFFCQSVKNTIYHHSS